VKPELKRYFYYKHKTVAGPKSKLSDGSVRVKTMEIRVENLEKKVGRLGKKGAGYN
jgi:hypothetical protein